MDRTTGSGADLPSGSDRAGRGAARPVRLAAALLVAVALSACGNGGDADTAGPGLDPAADRYGEFGEPILCVDATDGQTRLQPERYFHRVRGLVYHPELGLKGDLWLPASTPTGSPTTFPTPFPAVLHIHGGGWKGGHRGLRNAVLWAEHMACGGVAFFDVDYVLAPEARIPEQIRQTKCALRWLKGEAGRYRIDPERIASMGGSAGGHLAAMVGSTAGIELFEPTCSAHPDQDVRVAASIPVYGVLDFVAVQEDRIPLEFAFDEILPEEEPTDADWRRYSPITYVSPDDPPFLMIQGRGDLLVPFSQATAFASALSDVGVPSRITLLDAGQHAFDAIFSSDDTRKAVADLDAFVDDFLRAEGITP